jgi:hypothetical protein
MTTDLPPADLPINHPAKAEGETPTSIDDGKEIPPNAPSPEVIAPLTTENNHHPVKSGNEMREWGKFILESLTLIAVVWYACIASGQLKEMVKQYPEVKESAEAAKSSADTASDTLKQSQRSFQIDQRPYLIVDGAPELVGGRPTLSGNPVEANVWIKNIGKTPAIKEQAWGSLSLYNPPASVDAKAPAMLAFLDQSFSKLEGLREKELSNRFVSVVRQDVAPQARILSTFQTKTPLSGNDIGNIERGEAGLIYTVIIVYVDPFNETHETQFCQYFAGTDPTIWHICSERNTIQ